MAVGAALLTAALHCEINPLDSKCKKLGLGGMPCRPEQLADWPERRRMFSWPAICFHIYACSIEVKPRADLENDEAIYDHRLLIDQILNCFGPFFMIS